MQGCTNPGRLACCATKFCAVEPSKFSIITPVFAHVYKNVYQRTWTGRKAPDNSRTAHPKTVCPQQWNCFTLPFWRLEPGGLLLDFWKICGPPMERKKETNKQTNKQTQFHGFKPISMGLFVTQRSQNNYWSTIIYGSTQTNVCSMNPAPSLYGGLALWSRENASHGGISVWHSWDNVWNSSSTACPVVNITQMIQYFALLIIPARTMPHSEQNDAWRLTKFHRCKAIYSTRRVQQYTRPHTSLRRGSFDFWLQPL